MTQNQKDAIRELETTLERVKNERLLIVWDNDKIHVADYDELSKNGFYEGAGADEEALKKTEHRTFEATVVDVLDKWKYGTVGDADDD